MSRDRSKLKVQYGIISHVYTYVSLHRSVNDNSVTTVPNTFQLSQNGNSYPYGILIEPLFLKTLGSFCVHHIKSELQLKTEQ